MELESTNISTIIERRLRYYYTASFVIPFAEGMMDLSLILVVAAHSTSTLSLGYLQGLTLVPSLLLVPFTGVLIDRLGAENAVIIGTCARLVLCFCFAVICSNGRWNAFLFYVLVCCYYAAWNISSASFDALLKFIIRSKASIGPVSASQGAFQFGLLVSAIATGALAQWLGVSITMICIASILALSLALILRLRALMPSTNEMIRLTKPATRNSPKATFRFISDKQLMPLILIASCVIPFYQALNVLIAPFVLHSLRGNALTLGAVDSAAGIGALITSFVWYRLQSDERLSRLLLTLCIPALAGAVVFFASSSSVILAVLAYTLVGGIGSSIRVLSRTLIYDRLEEQKVAGVFVLITVLTLGLGIVAGLGVGLAGTNSIGFAYFVIASFLLIVFLSVTKLRSQTAPQK